MNTISMIPFASSDVGAFETTLLGMGTVFVVLVILMFSIKLLTAFFGREKTEKAKQESSPSAATPAAPQSEPAKVEQNDDEIVAVITAAIQAANGGNKLVIRSIRQKGTALNVWSKMGVEETMLR